MRRVLPDFATWQEKRGPVTTPGWRDSERLLRTRDPTLFWKSMMTTSPTSTSTTCPPYAWVSVPAISGRSKRKVFSKYRRATFPDTAISHELLLDHGAMVPLHLIAPATPVVPIILNTVIEPMPSPARVYAFGKLIRNIIAARPKGERVALMGTGGLSHWVGTPEMGRIDREFDEWFLEAAAKGAGEELATLTPEELGMHGNGAHELRNWIAVYGAIGDVKGEVVAYEAPFSWYCGCGAVLY